MSEPTGCAGGCPRTDTHHYCDRCDLLVGLPGLRVIQVHIEKARLVVTVEVCVGRAGLPRVWGDRRQPRPENGPARRRAFVRPAGTGRVAQADLGVQPSCPSGVFTEQHDGVARPRALLTTRACWWAIRQLRFEHASVLGLARQLGTM